MENIELKIDSFATPIVKKILNFFNLTLSDLVYFILYIVLIFIITYIISYIKKPIKYYLYTKRNNSYYRYLYYRIDKIFKPLIYFLLTHFITKAILNIYKFKEDSDFFIIVFIIKLLLILWLGYEIIKYFIYATIRNKIKSQKIARKELFNLLLNISKIIIVFIAIIAILSKFGVDVTALITSLGIGGVIIGFSAKDTLVNFFDSIRLIAEDAFRQGDWIETKDIEGFVTELGLTSTKIRTFDNAMVTIPNSKLANDYVKNWTKRLIGRRIKFHIPIKYTTNTDEIDRVIYEIYEMLHSHADIVNLNKVKYLKRMDQIYENGLFNLEDKYGVRKTLLVYLDEIGEYSLNILVYAFSISVNWEEWLRVKQDVIKRIIKIIDNSELEFAYPTRDIFLENSK
jgi:MscS family membrane protein